MNKNNFMTTVSILWEWLGFRVIVCTLALNLVLGNMTLEVYLKTTQRFYLIYIYIHTHTHTHTLSIYAPNFLKILSVLSF